MSSLRDIRKLRSKTRLLESTDPVPGPIGTTGEKGDKGDKGDTGSTGAKGDTPALGSETDYTEFESDGTMLMVGKATVFNDIVCPLIVRTTGVNRPALATFVGNILQYVFEVDDYAEIEAIELPHCWKEGSEIEIHIHWATGGLNDGTPRKVKWEIEYAYAGMSGGAFTSTTTDSAEGTIAANEAAGTLHYTTIDTFTPTGYTIGTQMVMRVKRIAGTGTEPAADPFALAVGVHIEQDTIGSRERGSKANT
jgi:hypothetical protein